MQAHLSSGVVMDIAAFKISHSVDVDVNATAVIQCLISVHVGVGQRCRARDGESPGTLLAMSTRNVPAGFVRGEAKVTFQRGL